MNEVSGRRTERIPKVVSSSSSVTSVVSFLTPFPLLIPFVSGGPSGRTALGSDDRREEKSAERDMETVPDDKGAEGKEEMNQKSRFHVPPTRLSRLTFGSRVRRVARLTREPVETWKQARNGRP